MIDRFQVKSQYCNLGKSMLQYSLAFLKRSLYTNALDKTESQIFQNIME